MNKNLKKVISAIAAFAVSASSVVAFAAANYPDVPETASYAQAVKELSALEVINGYEDGTFQPDKNVTRAEITKMIVTALGSSSLSAANAATGKDTQFDDVKGTHWASGYVTVGTSAGTQFINGYSATEFGPEDNVTFAQATKMLVAALGYTTYAENNGGWPNGYLTYGYNLDINKGVTGVANDTQLTRAQVAQMIDNAVKAPICVVDGYTTQWNGTQTPNLVEKNETNMYYKDTWQCLLNYSHDAYIVNGRVQKTHQSDPSVKTDEVVISIEKSNNYDGYQVSGGYTQGAKLGDQTAYIGESDADKYLLTYAEMIVQMDEDDELTILSITPVGSNKTEEFPAEDLDERTIAEAGGNYSMVDKSLKVYVNGSTTKTTTYRLNTESNGVGFYVNGQPVAENIAADSDALAKLINDYVIDNATGTVTLIDSPNEGVSSTDGKYDYIMVTFYKDAVVDSVIGDDEEATIYFSEMDLGLDSTMTVDTTDEDKYYSFTLDGVEIKATDLQEDDVLSIAYTGTNFSDSDSYTVLVSRDTAEGQVSSKGADEGTKTEFTVNGETYKVASTDLVSLGDIKVGSEYVLSLDAFGRIAKVDETANSTKIALLENVYTANGDQYYATIITPDGKKTNYTIKDKTLYNTYRPYVYDSSDNKIAPEDRVYGYSVSSSTGNITIKDKQTKNGGVVEYRESTNRLGSIRLNDSLTSVLDLSDYSSDKTVEPMDIDLFEDSAEYTAYGFNKLSDNSYQLVLVTDGGSGAITYKTEFAIFSKKSSQSVDGENKVTYTVYEPGATAPTTLILDDDSVDVSITEGAPIVVKKNSAGYVTEVNKLFNVNLGAGYANFASTAREALKDNDLTGVVNVTAADNTLTKGSGKNESRWVFGAVYDRSGNSITIATADDFQAVKDNYTAVAAKADADRTDAEKAFKAMYEANSGAYMTNVTALEDFDVDPDANILVYNYKERDGKQLRVSNGVLSSVLKLTTVKAAFVDADQDTYLDWASSALTADEGAQYGRESFIFAKTIDGDITEAYVIVPSTSKN